ncbi:MAG: nicotinate (nicotinamide) nucleotide adenylyltransferase [bacterium]|nr:nicotinate (nicotinamide) nucleotide adenylyltransferase [bacterium]
MRGKKDKVGLLGGTFNPVHRGHIDLGLQIREAFGLEKILYILAAQPPHKTNLNVAPTEIRWRMLNEVLARFPQLEPCDSEMKRPTVSWTIDTVEELRKGYPETDFYFISGSEGFLKVRTWKDYKRLLNALSFIVVLRGGGHREAVERLLQDENIRFDGPSAPVHLFSYESDMLFISSTLIRDRVKRSQGVDGLVEEEVKKIMEENNLYAS